MYKYGMTQWVAGNEDIEVSFKRLSRLGYDSIEYASDPYSMDRERCKDLMSRYNMQCLSLCGLFNEDRDLTKPLNESENARRYVRDSIDLAVEMGAKVLIVVPSPVGRTSIPAQLSYERAWDNAVINLKDISKYAEDSGVTLAIEPINRYETYLVNTIEQASRMARQADSKAIAIMADAFHMSIEEANVAASVVRAGALVRHVHIADSNRAAAGMGHTDFSSLLNALDEIGYSGTLTMEFMCRTADPYAARDISTLSEMMDGYAKISIDYMKALENGVMCR